MEFNIKTFYIQLPNVGERQKMEIQNVYRCFWLMNKKKMK